jgi:hypothetical protein
MARNFTQELLRARDEGADIVCATAPYEDVAVSYHPRCKRDPLPWIFTAVGRGDTRFTGRECKAVGTGGGPWSVARLLRLR